MSFSSFARRVRDSNRPMKERVWGINSCISALSFMIKPSYHELRAKYRPWNGVEPTEAELLACLHALEQLREQYHAKRKAFILLRQAQKRKGRRHLRRADLEAVGDIAIPHDSSAPE